MMGNKKNIKELPMIPLRGLSVFPHMVLHFDVGRDKSINALEEAMINDQLIFLASQKKLEVEEPKPKDFYQCGTVCKVKQMLKLPGDAIRVLVEGQSRAKIQSVLSEEPYFNVEVQIYDEVIENDNEVEALMRNVTEAFENYVSISKKVTPDVLISISSIDDPGRFADVVASNLSLKMDKKQEIIEAVDPKERLKIVLALIYAEVEIMEVENQINSEVKGNINKRQKEYYLREKLKVIQKELGDEETKEDEIKEMKKKLNTLDLKDEIHDKVMKEIDRLSKINPSSSESNVIRSYINWILDLPWNESTQDKLDLSRARKILEEDHYGLKDVKERVIEYLAIRELKETRKGPIICLVGPPGVGKTSIAKSIARALDRKFIRMSLGGVKDEAEIRGHRRTYIGAIPGRIINGIKEAGTNNPVFLFDEIDKVSNSFKGDPASALLEVLDPEQNKEFTDHYLEVPFDLSKVMFITTANNLSTIPRPLRDRMEVIKLPGYTQDEKLKIAQRYLVDKQRKENGIDEDNLSLSENTLKKIINEYTREAGVRELERQIGKICRKVAAKIVEEDRDSVRVDLRNIKKYLGVPKFSYDEIDAEDQIGVATGLAWTPMGGDTLSIEVVIMKGKGKLVLTGKLGDVMKESAQAGLSYIRSIADAYDIDENFYKENDIHIHIPEGAIPKDGPSAGITMTTAILSALTNKKVKRDLAMTGEVTLRGRVLPIGGLKEKALAAKRAGIKTILFPNKNKKHLEEIPKNVKRSIEFIPVKHMDEVLKHAFVDEDEE